MFIRYKVFQISICLEDFSSIPFFDLKIQQLQFQSYSGMWQLMTANVKKKNARRVHSYRATKFYNYNTTALPLRHLLFILLFRYALVHLIMPPCHHSYQQVHVSFSRQTSQHIMSRLVFRTCVLICSLGLWFCIAIKQRWHGAILTHRRSAR